MKYCQHCGTALKDQDAFCAACGSAAPSAPTPIQREIPSPSIPDPIQNERQLRDLHIYQADQKVENAHKKYKGSASSIFIEIFLGIFSLIIAINWIDTFWFVFAIAVVCLVIAIVLTIQRYSAYQTVLSERERMRDALGERNP